MSNLSGFISNFGGSVSPLDIMSLIQTTSTGGYIKLNNFIIQFSMGPATNFTVTYPIAFTNCWGAFATDSTGNNNVVTVSTTNTTLSIRSGSTAVYWFAWGN